MTTCRDLARKLMQTPDQKVLIDDPDNLLSAFTGVLVVPVVSAEQDAQMISTSGAPANYFYREVVKQDQQISDSQLRDLWRKHGGTFHGPNVEYGTIPEDRLLPLLRGLLELTVSLETPK